MSDLISRSALIKKIRDYADEVGCVRGEYELANGILKAISVVEEAPSVEAKPEWIPFKTREADEDEQHEYGFTRMMDCKLLENDEEILVTYDNGYVTTDTFICDGFECYLDSNMELGTEALAWMPLPAPYNAERGGKNG